MLRVDIPDRNIAWISCPISSSYRSYGFTVPVTRHSEVKVSYCFRCGTSCVTPVSIILMMIIFFKDPVDRSYLSLPSRVRCQLHRYKLL